MVNTTAFPTRSPANPGFVHLNMVLGLSTDPVLVGPHHARAELVENLKGRLVARKTKVPLKLHGGHAGRLTGDQISGPEPDVQRSVATLHHCSHRQPGVLAALAAAQDARAVFKVERLSRRAAVRAGKAVIPSGLSPARRQQAASSGKRRWNSGSKCGNGRSARSRTSMARYPYIRFAPLLALVGVGVRPDRQGLLFGGHAHMPSLPSLIPIPVGQSMRPGLHPHGSRHRRIRGSPRARLNPQPARHLDPRRKSGYSLCGQVRTPEQ